MPGQVNQLIVARIPHPLPSSNTQKVSLYFISVFLVSKHKTETHESMRKATLLEILSSHFSHCFCVFFRFACCNFFFSPSYLVRNNWRGFLIWFWGSYALASTWKMNLPWDKQCPLWSNICDIGTVSEFAVVCFTCYLWHWPEPIVVWFWKHLKGSLPRGKNLENPALCQTVD